jgi:hypothetical protein
MNFVLEYQEFILYCAKRKGKPPHEGGVPDRKKFSYRSEYFTEKTGTSGKEYNGLEGGCHGESAATA